MVIMVGFLLLILGSLKQGKSKIEGGGVVIIGPLPIVIGTSEKAAKILLVLAILLTTLALILYLVSSGVIGLIRLR